MERTTLQGNLSGQVYDFCPGNGTKYELFLGRVKRSDTPDSREVLVWPLKGILLYFSVYSPLHWQYVREKTGLKSEADITALMTFAHEHTGVVVTLPPGFGPDCQWEGLR